MPDKPIFEFTVYAGDDIVRGQGNRWENLGF
jgi:hypothetical protein